MEPTKGTFRGQAIDLADARMMLTGDELAEVEVVQEDGSIVRPWRFVTVDPPLVRNEHGQLAF